MIKRLIRRIECLFKGHNIRCYVTEDYCKGWTSYPKGKRKAWCAYCASYINIK